jgi:transcriptional regulator with XRE-family HTH domain
VIDYETFARIRDCRDRQRLTITEIARTLSLHRQTVAKWLARSRFERPAVAALIAIGGWLLFASDRANTPGPRTTENTPTTTGSARPGPDMNTAPQPTTPPSTAPAPATKP